MMLMISWLAVNKAMTLAGAVDDVKTLAYMFERQAIKYKISDRLGIVLPTDLGVGDVQYWQTHRDDPLY